MHCNMQQNQISTFNRASPELLVTSQERVYRGGGDLNLQSACLIDWIKASPTIQNYKLLRPKSEQTVRPSTNGRSCALRISKWIQLETAMILFNKLIQSKSDEIEANIIAQIEV